MRKRAKYGSIKEIVWKAKELNLSVPELVKLYGINRSSAYHCARDMGIKLKTKKLSPNNKNQTK
jgi:hypothetical protein